MYIYICMHYVHVYMPGWCALKLWSWFISFGIRSRYVCIAKMISLILVENTPSCGTPTWALFQWLGRCVVPSHSSASDVWKDEPMGHLLWWFSFSFHSASWVLYAENMHLSENHNKNLFTSCCGAAKATCRVPPQGRPPKCQPGVQGERISWTARIWTYNPNKWLITYKELGGYINSKQWGEWVEWVWIFWTDSS